MCNSALNRKSATKMTEHAYHCRHFCLKIFVALHSQNKLTQTKN